MRAFTIKDIENLSGVKAHTIRIWEQRYNFLKPGRTDTNIRSYSNEDLKTILNVSLLYKSGYKISHINKMDADEISKKIVLLTHPHVIQEKILNELVGCMIDFETDAFEMILDKYLKQKGMDGVINEIIFPFLEKIGILWTTNHINPAQEHLVTNIIRQKLLVGIEKTIPLFYSPVTALLFLPEGEHHEIGLLYVYYLLKKAGIKVLYLGADVPLNDLECLVKIKQPHYIYTHLTSPANHFHMERFLNNLHGQNPRLPCYISGFITSIYKKDIPKNIHFKKSLDEVRLFIAESSSGNVSCAN